MPCAAHPASNTLEEEEVFRLRQRQNVVQEICFLIVLFLMSLEEDSVSKSGFVWFLHSSANAERDREAEIRAVLG